MTPIVAIIVRNANALDEAMEVLSGQSTFAGFMTGWQEALTFARRHPALVESTSDELNAELMSLYPPGTRIPGFIEAVDEMARAHQVKKTP